jgi:hypothetical protein
MSRRRFRLYVLEERGVGVESNNNFFLSMRLGPEVLEVDEGFMGWKEWG